MRYFNIAIMLVPLMLLANSDLVEKTKIINKENSFIDKIDSQDPEIQLIIKELKEDFQNEKEQINDKYKIKRETLKKQRQQEVDYLRVAFKKKIKKLKEKYSDRIDLDKRKHDKADRRHTKPLNKSKNIYNDPRESSKNTSPEIIKSVNHNRKVSCTKSCCNNKNSKIKKKKNKPLKNIN